jgi:hypothetical protein
MPRDIHGNKLCDIVRFKRWENAILERIIVRYYIADVYTVQTKDRFIVWDTKIIHKPFSTSLISPGGACKRKLDAA